MNRPTKVHDTLVYRLSQVLQKLNQGESLDPQQLADEFGVNLRTIQRDLNVRFASLPLIKTAGRYRMEDAHLGKLTLKDIEKFASLSGVSGLFPQLTDQFLREVFASTRAGAWLVKGHHYEDLRGQTAVFAALERAIIDHHHIAFALAYPQYERECKRLWVADAEKSHPTSHIEADINERMAKPLQHTLITFDIPIRDFESHCSNIREVLSEATENLKTLDRDYKSELDVAYKSQNESREQLYECRKNLSKAYDDLNVTKDKLDAWYSKAEGNWIGNGGNKLPSRSFFGQDLSDRDHYKSERDRLSSYVVRLKTERSRIELNLDDELALIKRIKDARQQMFNLKSAGFDKRKVTSAINAGNAELKNININIEKLVSSRDAYLQHVKTELGIYALENQIAWHRRECDARINAFDGEEFVRKRKLIHKTIWLAQHKK